MKKVLVLGSTGSIGCNAIEVLRELKASHIPVGLSGHSNSTLLIKQAREIMPSAVGVTDPAAEAKVREELGRTGIRILSGAESLCGLIDLLEPDIVLVAVSGTSGLAPSLMTLHKGKRLALANKESLVMAGHLLTEASGISGSELLPVDSEHNAVFQALGGEDRSFVNRIILTASGGPFVDLPAEKFKSVTPLEALKHPTWNMGKKITIDSATMMNKALEIVEAKWLFDMHPSKIEVVVHRQSIVHGMAEFTDGSIIAQMGMPDMKVPICHAMTYPARFRSGKQHFFPASFSELTFEEPDDNKFPAIRLGYRAANEGGLAGTVLNAANEIAVDLFLKGNITFDEITRIVERVMDLTENKASPSFAEISAADMLARKEALKCSSQ